MRKQIRGLDQGVENAQEGVSLCQVADGALAEVTSMLQRITELSVQSANGTNSESDRMAIQKEVHQILTEIDRIGETTKFNENKIFDGNMQVASGKGLIIGYRPEITTTTIPVQKFDSFEFQVSGASTDSVEATYTVSTASVDSGFVIGNDTYTWDAVKDENGVSIDISKAIPAGEYSFEHKGMNVSFDIEKDVEPTQFVDGIKGMSWTSKAASGTQFNYSLTAKTPADYTNTKESYTIEATEEGLVVNSVLYSWPSSIKNGALAGNKYSISAGDLELELSVGTNNTASLSEIVQSIGTKKIYESTKTITTTPITQMSMSKSDTLTDLKTSNEMIELMGVDSRVKADADGVWVELGDKSYRKISWAELDAGATYDSNGLMKRVYSDDNLRFSFSTQTNMSTDEIANLLNGAVIKVSRDAGTHEDVISVTPADYYHNGNYDYYFDNLTASELDNALLLKHFSFTATGDGTPTYLPDPDNIEWTTSKPHIMSDPTKVVGGTGFNKSYVGNTLTVGDSGIVTDNYELQNADDLIEYFRNRPSYKVLKDTGELDLVFKKGNSVITVKMVDDLANDYTLNDFVTAITDRASYYNEPLMGLVFTETGEDVNYMYNVEVNKSISTQVQYSQYNGTVSSMNKNMSAYMADTVVNVPKYSYMENETHQQVIQVPIYGTTMEEGNGDTWIQSGAETWDGMMLRIEKMNTSILGIKDLNLGTEDGAENALGQIDVALKKVSENRSRIGAQQNRLEHTIANENNIIENTTSAESRIRDTDMAEEMVEYSKNNILAQAGQSMLAQANTATQGVLSLLQ